MNLKATFRLLGACALLSIFASCSSSYQSASYFGSRKYTKGYFANNRGSVNNPVATNNAPVTAKAEATSSTASVNKNQTVTAPVVSKNIISTPTKVASVSSAKAKAMPSHTKMERLANKVASNSSTTGVSNETMGASSIFASSYSPENTRGLEANEAVKGHSSSSGSMFDFKNHPVRTVFVILLVVLIVALLAVALANGDATVTTSAS